MLPCKTLPGVKGYGEILVDGTRHALHRWIVEQVEGPLAPGEVVRHKCDNPPCFLYDHLERGTVADNNRDASERGRLREPRCKRNHPFDKENTRIMRGGERRCRACEKVRYAETRCSQTQTQS